MALAGLCVSPWVGAQGLPETPGTDTAVSDKAESQQAAAPKFNYAIGGIVGSSPDYAGGDGRKNSLRPAWAIEYGRFRLSTSRGSAFMGHGLGPSESGASATLAGFVLAACAAVILPFSAISFSTTCDRSIAA